MIIYQRPMDDKIKDDEILNENETEEAERIRAELVKMVEAI